MTKTFNDFSDEELSTAIEHARKKHDFPVDGQLLRVLANDIGRRMEGETIPFLDAQAEKLKKIRFHRGKNEKRAYCCALGRLFSCRQVSELRARIPGFTGGVPAPIPVLVENRQVAWGF